MRTCLVLSFAAAALAGGCDLSRAKAGDPNLDAVSSSSVVGVIYLPQGLSESDWCKRLTVEAAAQGTPVGRTAIRESRGRCSYEVSRLPSQQEISVTVKLPACPSGASAHLAPPPQPLLLKDHETKTQDFRASCAS